MLQLFFSSSNFFLCVAFLHVGHVFEGPPLADFSQAVVGHVHLEG